MLADPITSRPLEQSRFCASRTRKSSLASSRVSFGNKRMLALIDARLQELYKSQLEAINQYREGVNKESSVDRQQFAQKVLTVKKSFNPKEYQIDQEALRKLPAYQKPKSRLKPFGVLPRLQKRASLSILDEDCWSKKSECHGKSENSQFLNMNSDTDSSGWEDDDSKSALKNKQTFAESKNLKALKVQTGSQEQRTHAEALKCVTAASFPVSRNELEQIERNKTQSHDGNGLQSWKRQSRRQQNKIHQSYPLSPNPSNSAVSDVSDKISSISPRDSTPYGYKTYFAPSSDSPPRSPSHSFSSRHLPNRENREVQFEKPVFKEPFKHDEDYDSYLQEHQRALKKFQDLHEQPCEPTEQRVNANCREQEKMRQLKQKRRMSRPYIESAGIQNLHDPRTIPLGQQHEIDPQKHRVKHEMDLTDYENERNLASYDDGAEPELSLNHCRHANTLKDASAGNQKEGHRVTQRDSAVKSAPAQFESQNRSKYGDCYSAGYDNVQRVPQYHHVEDSYSYSNSEEASYRHRKSISQPVSSRRHVNTDMNLKGKVQKPKLPRETPTSAWQPQSIKIEPQAFELEKTSMDQIGAPNASPWLLNYLQDSSSVSELEKKRKTSANSTSKGYARNSLRKLEQGITATGDGEGLFQINDPYERYDSSEMQSGNFTVPRNSGRAEERNSSKGALKYQLDPNKEYREQQTTNGIMHYILESEPPMRQVDPRKAPSHGNKRISRNLAHRSSEDFVPSDVIAERKQSATSSNGTYSSRDSRFRIPSKITVAHEVKYCSEKSMPTNDDAVSVRDRKEKHKRGDKWKDSKQSNGQNHY